MNPYTKITLFLKKSRAILCGILFPLLLLLFVILSLPIYLFRFIVTLITKRFNVKLLGNPITSLGTYFACEFLPSNLKNPPRSTVVTTFVVEGQLTIESTEALLKRRWFDIVPEGGETPLKCRYPELQQYVESWMGFLFWKQDPEFQLQNHLKIHHLDGNSSSEMEKNLCSFIEELINKPYPPKRSPWEIYIVPNYEDETNECHYGVKTLILTRFHHCLADGYSILYAVVEQLLNTPLPTFSIPSDKEFGGNGLAKNILFWLEIPFKILYDLVQFFITLLHSPATPWHVPDEKKSWHQLYNRSQPIPIQDIKCIKNRLGVRFSSVLLSAISAGISRSINANCNSVNGLCIREIPISFVLSLPNHPKKMRNHLTVAVLQFPTDPNMSPIERLVAVEQSLESAKQNTLPLIHPFLVKAFGCHFAKVCKLVLENRYVATGFSNFPGPGITLEWEEGKKVLSCDAAAGAQRGVAGVGFVVVSFNKHIRISITAESAVMTRTELKELMAHISDEIETLQELSM